MVPMLHCTLGHILAQVVDSRGNVKTSIVGAVEKLSDECGEREELDVQGLFAS